MVSLLVSSLLDFTSLPIVSCLTYKLGTILATKNIQSNSGLSIYCNLVLSEANWGKRLASELFRGNIFRNIILGDVKEARLWKDSWAKVSL